MRQQRQRGLSSVMLIAMIVLLATMAGYAMNFLASAQAVGNADLLATRARQAAEAGVEWQRLRLRGAAPACAAATNLNIPFGTGNFPVTVQCQQTSPGTYTDDTATLRTYQFTATACWPPNAGGSCGVVLAAQQPDYVERSITGLAVCDTATGVCYWPR